jgi:hypothetical protein
MIPSMSLLEGLQINRSGTSPLGSKAGLDHNEHHLDAGPAAM